LKFFRIVFLREFENWYLLYRTYILKHVVKTIREQVYAILEENSMRIWKLDCLISIDWKKQKILYKFDNIAFRFIWTFCTTKRSVYRYFWLSDNKKSNIVSTIVRDKTVLLIRIIESAVLNNRICIFDITKFRNFCVLITISINSKNQSLSLDLFRE